jgi:hypothetical protein
MTAPLPAGTGVERPLRADDGKPDAEQTQVGLMTPARRAALDALEREFSDLLKTRLR